MVVYDKYGAGSLQEYGKAKAGIVDGPAGPALVPVLKQPHACIEGGLGGFFGSCPQEVRVKDEAQAPDFTWGGYSSAP